MFFILQVPASSVPANSRLSVFDSYSPSKYRRKIATSTSSLQGSWKLDSSSPSWSPIRYEVTAGTILSPGDGVYDIKRDMVWKDVGLMTNAVVTLPVGKRLVARNTYNIYVRVWYNGSTYGVFRSPGVSVDVTPPAIFALPRVSGESQLSPRHSNFFTGDLAKLNVSWQGSFSDPQSEIDYFIYGLGTTPGGKL